MPSGDEPTSSTTRYTCALSWTIASSSIRVLCVCVPRQSMEATKDNRGSQRLHDEERNAHLRGGQPGMMRNPRKALVRARASCSVLQRVIGEGDGNRIAEASLRLGGQVARTEQTQ